MAAFVPCGEIDRGGLWAPAVAATPEENSEVFWRGSVAVAVMTLSGAPEKGKETEKLALPELAVVAEVAPK